MNIDKLDDNRLLISLSGAEAMVCVGSLSCASELLGALVSLAAVKSGFSLHNRRFTVRTLNGVDCFFLIVSIFPQAALPFARIGHFAVSFANAYDTVSCIMRLGNNDDAISYSRLYHHAGSYTLTVGHYGNDNSIFLSMLTEYGTAVSLSRKRAALLEERAGSPISDNIVHKMTALSRSS